MWGQNGLLALKPMSSKGEISTGRTNLMFLHTQNRKRVMLLFSYRKYPLC